MSRVAATWLNDLATLVAGATPISDLKAKVAGMSAMLGDDYPPEAFNRASLNHVARQIRFFPSYGELTEHLSAWWQAHRPPPRALPAPSHELSVEEEDRQFWNTITSQQLREKTAEIDAMTGPMATVVRDALRRSYVNGLTRYAPHRLGWLPPHWLPREPTDPTPLPVEPEPQQPRPKPSYFTPEQLAALRKPKAAA